MKCPVCRATYRAPESAIAPKPCHQPCHRCGADLAMLIELYDQAIGHHRQAIAQFAAGDRSAAIAANNQAIALHSQHSKFHALAGQLWALQGEFELAIRSWQIAQRLDPQANGNVSACLEICAQLLLDRNLNPKLGAD